MIPICIILLALVNGLFVLKYSSRIIAMEYAYVLSISLLFAALIGYLVRERIKKAGDFFMKKSHLSIKSLVYVLLIFIIGIWVVSFFLVPKESLRVDRWLMIKTFWDNVFSGNYPYVPIYSNNVPGQLPIYHILALPFHAIGEIGLLSVVVFIGLLWGIKKFNNTEKGIISLPLFLLLWLCSPAIWWESVTRSTIVMNMNLVILFLLYSEQKGRKAMNQGVLSGLLIATRSSVAIPLSVGFFGTMIRENQWKKLLFTSFITVMIPVMCLGVLYSWDAKLFIQYNPLSMQSLFLPTWLSIVLVGLSILLGIKATDVRNKLFYSGLMLFCTVFCAFIYAVSKYGWHEAVFLDAFDISYFLQAAPFLMLATIQSSGTE